MLTVCYDLGCCPPTFEVASFLCRVEHERLSRNEDCVKIVLAPGPDGGFRKDSLWPRDVASRRVLMRNVVVPMCWMLPSVAEMEVNENRVGLQGVLGVGQRLYGLAEQVAAARRGIRPLRVRNRPAQVPGLVTITLREAEHWPARNSRLAEWIEAAHQMRRMGLTPVFIRDTKTAGQPIQDFDVDQGAAVDLIVRAHLYSSAVLNLFVSNGPAWMCWAMDLPTVVFHVQDPTCPATTKAYFERCGLPPGTQMPGSPPYQRLVWGVETSGLITDNVRELLEVVP